MLYLTPFSSSDVAYSFISIVFRFTTCISRSLKQSTDKEYIEQNVE